MDTESTSLDSISADWWHRSQTFVKEYVRVNAYLPLLSDIVSNTTYLGYEIDVDNKLQSIIITKKIPMPYAVI